MRTDPALVEAIETCHQEWDPTRSPDTAGFDALLERWPDDPVALVAVGDAHDVCGGTETAIASYRAAMPRLDGTALRRCALRLGDAHDECGGTETAIASYRAAMPRLDGTALRRCALRLGDALRRAGRLDESVAVLEAALEEFPGSRSLRTFLALALHEQGRTQTALGLVLEVLVDPAPSPDLELFRPAVRARAEQLFARDRAA